MLHRIEWKECFLLSVNPPSLCLGKFGLCVFEGTLGGGRTSKLSGTPSSVISFSFLPLQPSLTSKSNLLQQHESGLSSSSYELSQYMSEAPEQYEPMVSAAWRPIQAGGYQVAVGAG